MFDDFSAVSNYGDLSAQFYVGRLKLTEMLGFVSLSFNFLLKQLLKFILNIWFMKIDDR